MMPSGNRNRSRAKASESTASSCRASSGVMALHSSSRACRGSTFLALSTKRWIPLRRNDDQSLAAFGLAIRLRARPWFDVLLNVREADGDGGSAERAHRFDAKRPTELPGDHPHHLHAEPGAGFRVERGRQPFAVVRYREQIIAVGGLLKGHQHPASAIFPCIGDKLVDRESDRRNRLDRQIGLGTLNDDPSSLAHDP